MKTIRTQFLGAIPARNDENQPLVVIQVRLNPDQNFSLTNINLPYNDAKRLHEELGASLTTLRIEQQGPPLKGRGKKK